MSVLKTLTSTLYNSLEKNTIEAIRIIVDKYDPKTGALVCKKTTKSITIKDGIVTKHTIDIDENFKYYYFHIDPKDIPTELKTKGYEFYYFTSFVNKYTKRAKTLYGELGSNSNNGYLNGRDMIEVKNSDYLLFRPNEIDSGNFKTQIESKVTFKTERSIPKKPIVIPIPIVDSFRDYSIRLQIGYADLTISADKISISREQEIQQLPLLRNRVSIKKGHGHSLAVINLQITCPDKQDVVELAKLIRQVKKCPFLPIVNERVNSEDIDAVAVVGVSISTVPGFPGQIEASITCVEFDWKQYFPDETALSFSDLFCWPLFKLWCETSNKRVSSDILPTWDPNVELNEKLILKTVSTEAIKELANFEQRKPSNYFVSSGTLTEASKASEILKHIENKSNTLSNSDIIVNKSTGDNYYKIELSSMNTLRSLHKYLEDWITTTPKVMISKTTSSFGESDIRRLLEVESTTLDYKVYTLARASSLSSVLSLAGIAPPDYVYNTQLHTIHKEILENTVNYDAGSKYDLDPSTYTVYLNGKTARNIIKSIALSGVNLKKIDFLGKEVAVSNNIESKLYDTHEFDWIIENISADFGNNLAFQQAKGLPTPLVQYLGGSDTSISINGVMFNNEQSLKLKELWDYINNLAVNAQAYGISKDYKAFMKIENNISALMGVEHVVPNMFESSTVPQFPGELGFSLNLTEFNPSQSKREKLLDLIPKAVRADSKEGLETQQDTFERVFRTSKIYEVIEKTEVYPDLELPTVSELNKLIRDMEWSSPKKYVLDVIGEYYTAEYKTFIEKLVAGQESDKFVDPDFYVVSYLNHTPEVLAEMVSIWKENDKKSVHTYTGADGLKAYLSGGQILRQTSDIPLSVNGQTVSKDQISKLQAYDSFSPVQEAWDDIVAQEMMIQGSRSSVSVPGRIQSNTTIPDSFAGTIRYNSKQESKKISELRALIEDSNSKLLSPKAGWGKASLKPSVTVMSYSDYVFNSARETGVDPAFIFATIHAESSGSNLPFNSKGYGGLTQVSKLDASFVNKPESAVLDPKENIQIFSKLIKALAEGKFVKGYSAGKYPSTLIPVLAGKWNGGQNKSASQLSSSKEETTNHILRVTSLYLSYRNLFLSKALSNFLLSQSNNSNAIVPTDLYNKINEVNFYASELSKGTNPLKLNIQMDNITEYYNSLAPKDIFSFITVGAANGTFEKALTGKRTDKAFNSYNMKPEDIYEDNSMFEDHVKNEKRNSLLYAYPAYFISLIDGGRWIGYYRFYDRMFGIFGVSEIEVFKSREDPGHIATVVFSNMYNRLTDQLSETERLNELGKNRYTLSSMARNFVQSIVPIPYEEQIRMRGMLINSLLLKAGSRIHIRMGYGSNPLDWPNLFNGTIVEVPTDDSRVKVIAFGDGAELEKEIPVSMSTPVNTNGDMAYEVTALGGASKDPRNIIMELFLSTSEHTLGDLAYRISRGWYTHNNLFGIENFGRPYIDATSIDNPLNSLIPGISDGEVGVNIYEPRKDPMNVTKAPSNFLGWVWSDSDVMTGISVEEATPWKVIEVCRKVAPDFVASVMPFGFRSTLFYGKPWFPYYYEYDFDKIKKALTNPTEKQIKQANIAAVTSYKNPWGELTPEDLRKGLTLEFLQHPSEYMKKTSFLQVRSISSENNLLENRIAASKEDLYTAAQVTESADPWGSGRETRYSSFKYFDSEVWTENIKVKGAKSGVFVKTGGGFGEAINNGVAALPIIGSSLNGLTNQAFGGNLFGISSKANENVAVSELKDGLKKMYRGAVVIKGDASYRPFNLVHIMDIPKKMTGLFEVREVVHSFNSDSGFTTTITPDLCVSSVDPFIPQLWMIANRWGSGVGLAYLGSAINARLIRHLAQESLYGTNLDHVAELLKQDLLSTSPDSMQDSNFDKRSYEIDPTSELDKSRRRRDYVKRSSTAGDVPGIHPSDKLKDLLSDAKIIVEREQATASKKLIGKELRNRLVEVMLDKLKDLEKAGVVSESYTQLLKELIFKNNSVKSIYVMKHVKELSNKFNEKLKVAGLWSSKALPSALGTAKDVVSPVLNKDFIKNLIARKRSQEAALAVNSSLAQLGNNAINIRELYLLRAASPATEREATRLLNIIAKGAASANIVKLVLSAIGMDTVAELINRKFGSRKSAIIAPLRINGREFSAGIEGHRGGVVGDPINVLDNLLASWFNASYSAEQLGKEIDNPASAGLGILRTSFAGLMWVLGIQLDNPTDTEMFKFGDQEVFETLNIERYLNMNEIRSDKKISSSATSLVNRESDPNSSRIPVVIDSNRIIWEAQNQADKSSVNPELINDLALILSKFNWTVKISAAIRDHSHLGDRSRHAKGNALDISEINGIPIGNPSGIRNKNESDTNPKAKFYADKLAEAFQSIGYLRNKEDGNEKAVLWYFYNPQAGNHFNHIHISRLR